jgi:hypothetical protein
MGDNQEECWSRSAVTGSTAPAFRNNGRHLNGDRLEERKKTAKKRSASRKTARRGKRGPPPGHGGRPRAFFSRILMIVLKPLAAAVEARRKRQLGKPKRANAIVELVAAGLGASGIAKGRENRPSLSKTP